MESQIKPSQPEKTVEKAWGREEWIVNSDLYCGKKMILKKGHRCSVHHHKIKDETFYVQSGLVLMETSGSGEGKGDTIQMPPGSVIHIPPGLWHRFTGIEDSEIFEFSTRHMDSDSYRSEPSGRVDMDKIVL